MMFGSSSGVLSAAFLILAGVLGGYAGYEIYAEKSASKK